MTALAHSRPAPGTLSRLALTAIAAAQALYAAAEALDAWLARRRRASEDRDALASMSERELRDIGVSRGSTDEIAAGDWTRHWPR